MAAKENDWMETLQQKLAGLPDKPGVYIMKNAVGKVIYVGKAKILKNRVRSYFQNTEKAMKTEILVSHVRALDYIVTNTEAEALMVEITLIKKYKPQYNILLKDDKSYPYIRISMQETFPRIEFTRRIVKDGAKYYGSYVKAAAVRSAIDLIRKLFPIRTCKREIHVGDQQRPCLYYHIGLCSAPCCSAISADDYRELAKSACSFLEGKSETVLKQMETEMQEMAENMRYEQAAIIRDRIRSVQEVSQKQTVVSTKLENRDIIGLFGDDWHYAVSVLAVRSGRLVGKRAFTLFGKGSYEPADVMESFLLQYYGDTDDVPKEIVLMNEPLSMEAMQIWLTDRKGSSVKVIVPKRGTRVELMEMAVKNAQEELEQARRSELGHGNTNEKALLLMGEKLSLPSHPAHIEAYDVSNTGNTEIVASMVVFLDGLAETSRYRRFKMKQILEQDDYGSMQEIIRRRFKRHIDGSTDDAFGYLPDLLLIDGGVGHVSAVKEVLAEMGVSLPVWGMAKDDRHRSHQLVDETHVVSLSEFPELLRLVATIQNEAHRFAIAFNRNLRTKRQVKSVLDDIEGIGPAKKKALLRTLGSVTNIKQASLEEIAAVPGIGMKLAEVIKAALD